jgi:hypothetical protein
VVPGRRFLRRKHLETPFGKALTRESAASLASGEKDRRMVYKYDYHENAPISSIIKHLGLAVHSLDAKAAEVVPSGGC